MKESPQKEMASLKVGSRHFRYFPLGSLFASSTELERLPFCLRILLEALLRNVDGKIITEDDLKKLAYWQPSSKKREEVAFLPGRVLLQDFTGVPAIVDLAALRSSMARRQRDPQRINPQIPVDLVIDHSLQVDYFASSDALGKNMQKEFQRNNERYRFLKWGQRAFQNLRIVPPGIGIVHQVNLEYLASVTLERDGLLFPDSLVGTDSHTTMINGLGVLGWGVGGIEAEAVMLGEPIYMLLPDVVGFRLHEKLKAGATATDLVLRVTQMLRERGVVGKFVEFFGEGLNHLPLPDRATIANMAPEYGATCGYFPVDNETLAYLRRTGRKEQQVELTQLYFEKQGLFRQERAADPHYSDLLELDLSTVDAALSGPKRPQDRVSLKQMQADWRQALRRPLQERGFALDEKRINSIARIENGYRADITHGNVVIAAITSCTNTSNPGVMMAAGLLAKKAVEQGLQVKPYVKTSLAPGSRVVTDYLDHSGLSKALEKLGFHTVGYGCTTCIGNSGPLPENVVSAIQQNSLVVASVLSGNRNFEGRISPHVKANFLASPPLVIAYALAGTIDINLLKEPLGRGREGKDIYLHDIWPAPQEIQALIAQYITPSIYRERYRNVMEDNHLWDSIPVTGGEIYQWQEDSTYIREPDFFKDMPAEIPPLRDIEGARCLVKLGDSVTTDHISPAGAIPADMPAGRYLLERGVKQQDFNSFGSRRGNDQVMTRGTFGNIRLQNLLVTEREGGWTTHQPSGELMTIYDASLRYRQEGKPLIILAKREYGSGSSRDWAAKGSYSLGCRAVIAESFERIHRSNLVGMGVLPLQFAEGESYDSLGISGRESFTIRGLNDSLQPRQIIEVEANTKKFGAICRLDTPVEIEYYKNGGILPTVLRRFLSNSE